MAHANFAGLLNLYSTLRARPALWRRRMRDRAELAQWADRDIRDAGLSTGFVEWEVAKRFWRD